MSERLDPRLVEVLRIADHRLRSAARTDSRRRFDACRLAVASLVDLTSMYVGYYKGERTLVLRYVYDKEVSCGATVQEFGPHGLAAWVRASRKPYRWADDDGRLVTRGEAFGDRQPSRDALVVPLLDEEGHAQGLMGFLSSTPGVFDDVVLQGAEWLAAALGWAERRDERESEALALYDLYPELDSSQMTTAADLARHVIEEVGRMNDLAERCLPLLAARCTDEVVVLLTELREACQYLHHGLVDLTAHKDDSTRSQSWELLTAREQEVAHLVADKGLTNQAIAHRLGISERTVKGHVAGVLRKLEVHHRSEVAWMLGDAPGRERPL